MKRRIAVRAIIVKDGKLLCAQNKPYNPYINVNEWSTPGGGVDEGESLVPALQREIAEELGVYATVGKLLYVQQLEYGGSEHLQFFFHITNTEDFIHVDLSKTSHGIHEIEQLAFIDFTTPNIQPAFLALEPIAGDIASDGPVKFFSTLPDVTVNS
jgi:ADP-ribose pyrophosphatase YjhB (NUDIX family)